MPSKAVTTQILALSLVNSAANQLEANKALYSEETRRRIDRLHKAHDKCREVTAKINGIDISAKNKLMFEEKEYEQWIAKEKKFFDTVIMAIPEHQLDATMWLTVVLIAAEAVGAKVRRTCCLWDRIIEVLAAIYAEFDPDMERRKQMEEGALTAEKILNAME